MMKPYMGAYGIMRRPLNQPYNLELQIYWEIHGLSQLESKQWGTNTLAIDGGTHNITLPISISSALCAQVTMFTTDIPDIVLCPYWTGCTTTTINITTDYETGHSYAGNGSNRVSWLLVAI